MSNSLPPITRAKRSNPNKFLETGTRTKTRGVVLVSAVLWRRLTDSGPVLGFGILFPFKELLLYDETATIYPLLTKLQITQRRNFTDPILFVCLLVPHAYSQRSPPCDVSMNVSGAPGYQ
uniref:Uncharacterized protein n=1 Tax=Arundo donax TaxID=35708 RepID=A0A0A9EX24_ARUDO